MITISQIKAARTLLEWTQRDLAKQAGVSLASVANLEQGVGKIGGKVFDAVCKVLQQAGIEFTPEPGVRLRREKYQFRVLEGEHAVIELWDDIILALGKTGGEVLISGVSSKLWLTRYKEEVTAALIERRKLGIRNRHIIPQGDTLILSDTETYRVAPPHLLQQVPYYVYADRFAMINWGPPLRILLVHNALVAESFRSQFEFNFQHSRVLKKSDVVIAKLEGLPNKPI